MKNIKVDSLEKLSSIASEWLASLSPNDSGATVVGLYGNLGAGKTAFAQMVAKVLGVEEFVTSPSYVIEKIYDTKHPIFIRFVHIDAYRLDKASELQDLDFELLVENKNNLILIEWPENVKEILPDDIKKIEFIFINDKTRELAFY